MFSICLFSLLQESCLQWKVKTIIIFIRDSTAMEHNKHVYNGQLLCYKWIVHMYF